MNNNIPKQKVKFKKKNKEWREQCVKGFINKSSFGTSEKSELKTFYDAYNGNLNESDYNYVINPYNSTNNSKRNFPARLRSYNIIRPVIDLLLGEKAIRPSSHQVIVRNADAESKFLEERNQQLMQYMEQEYINELNSQGVDTGQESVQQEPPQQIEEKFIANYKDQRAIIGQEVISYIKSDLDLDDKFQKGFFDWLVAGQVFTYKGTCMNEPEYEIVSPLDIDYEKSPNSDYIEDSDWAARRSIMSLNEVVDRFYDLLEPKHIDKLESHTAKHREGISGITMARSIMGLNGAGDEVMSDRMIEVIHVTWKSFQKIGILTYIDEAGTEQMMEVGDTYIADEGESIEWFWVNEVWEGYQIDGDIYVGIRPLDVQRNQMMNLSSCKLPYNGRIYSNRYSENVSIVSMGMPYQVLYNVFHYRLELSIAKNKDKIALVEMNMIPKRHGWDEEKFMYYADAMGYMFIDSTAEGKNRERVTFNQFQVLDMSLGQYIAAQFQLLQAIKQEWEDLVGITRQRKGNINSSDSVGTTERAVAQSSTITEELFRRFEKIEEKDLLGLLDVCKYAWQEGKKANYITSDGYHAIMSIDPINFTESEFGVFVKNNSNERNKLQTMRELAMSFAQNGASMSTIAEILDSDNFAKIKSLVRKVEEKQAQMQQQAQQAEQQAQQMEMEKEAMTQQLEAQEKEMDRQHESIENELDRELQRELKGLDIQKEKEGDDGLEIENRKQNLEEQKFQHQRQVDSESLKIERIKANKSGSSNTK